MNYGSVTGGPRLQGIHSHIADTDGELRKWLGENAGPRKCLSKWDDGAMILEADGGEIISEVISLR